MDQKSYQQFIPSNQTQITKSDPKDLSLLFGTGNMKKKRKSRKN